MDKGDKWHEGGTGNNLLWGAYTICEVRKVVLEGGLIFTENSYCKL